MAAPSPGTILAGKYRVDRVLGEGGMGVVVKATHLELDESVALKFMLPEALASEQAKERFRREARAAVKLKSPHVARVLDVGTLENGSPFIVMEYLEGHDLQTLLGHRHRLPAEEAVGYVLQAIEGLAEAHALGIVHRDIKPANLFLAQEGGDSIIKILDFGISKAEAAKKEGGLTGTRAIMGSPQYMAPEQVGSARRVDARADIWALGVVLYELLSGRTPFASESVGELLAAVLRDRHAPLRSFCPELSPHLEVVVDRCLAKDAESRFAHVADLAGALAPFGPADAARVPNRVARVLGRTFNPTPPPAITAQPSAPTPPPAFQTGPPPVKAASTVASAAGEVYPGPGGRGRVIVASTLISLVVGLAVAAFFVWNRGQGSSEPVPAAAPAALAEPGPAPVPTPPEPAPVVSPPDAGVVVVKPPPIAEPVAEVKSEPKPAKKKKVKKPRSPGSKPPDDDVYGDR